ncbi:MAG TPA: NmrA family NAD(P)-binding protein [Vicinamibacterales bacterium]|nr:NmrA family NAD(P)-binding protein [Vicinamibacterales bacterium]
MLKFVVAGGTGRVGSAVAQAMSARGAAPTLLVRRPGLPAQTVRSSLDDRIGVANALRGAHGFFVLLPESVNPDDFHGARRRMADAIAAAVHDSGVPHVVMLSALPAVVAQGSGPCEDLHYFEQRLRETGAVVTILRSCYFQDNVRDVLMPARHAGIFPTLLPADAAMPMVATTDVGRFIAEALLAPSRGSEIVDVLGPMYSIRQVAAALGAALGRPLTVVEVPPEQHVEALTRGGLPPQIATAIAEMMACVRAGRVAPSGDRQLAGTTPINDTVLECVRRFAPSA